jgi:ubiquinone/menaquinone biosynthesis C-methylase UbiE
MSESETANYALGHSPTEIRRLGIQAAIIRPITIRLLQALGVCPGMRILDVGCGTGDVALLVSQLVGDSGAVVGIDRSETVILAARARAAGAKNVQFLVNSPHDALHMAPFDIVVGRYVLIHQEDVPSFIRASAKLVKPGGIVAFHEIDDADDFAVLPEIPVWTQANAWLMSALRSLLPNPDVAGKLVDIFSQAGFGAPALFCEVPIGDGAQSPLATWLAETLRTLLPQIIQRGWASEEAVDIDSLEKRLRAAASTTHSQVSAPRQVCAWVKVPS